MAFARLRGKKIIVLHNFRHKSRIQQKRLHTFNNAAEVFQLLADDDDWEQFCDSLDVALVGKSRVDRKKLRAQLTDMTAKVGSEPGDPLQEAVGRLLAILEEMQEPLTPPQKDSLWRASEELDRLLAVVDEKIEYLTREEGNNDMTSNKKAPSAECSAEQHLDRGLEIYQSGQWDEAKRIFLDGLSVQPDHVDLLVHLGLCEMMHFNTELALAHFDKAASVGQAEADLLIASDPTEFVKEVDCTARSSAQEPIDEEAAFSGDHADLYSHLEFRPFFRALTNKAVALIDLRRYEEAIDTLRFCRSYEALIGTSNMIGLCYLAIGEVETASRWQKEMLWPDAHYVRALIEYRLGNTEAAIRYLLYGIPWNQHIATMLTGLDKPDKMRYNGNLSNRQEASEFMHRHGHIFRRSSGFKTLVRCVLDDPTIDDLLTELIKIDSKEKKNTQSPSRYLMQFINGAPDEEFLSYHAPRLMERFRNPTLPYWLPREGDTLSVTVLEQKTQNWLVELTDAPTAQFYLRPKGNSSAYRNGETLTICVTKAWRHRGRLYVSATLQ